MGWVFLAAAILFEVSATVFMKLALKRGSIYYVGSVLGYSASFFFLYLTLAQGVPLGIAYGIWAAAGVALMAFLGRAIFREPLNGLMIIGILLIVFGVVLVKI